MYAPLNILPRNQVQYLNPFSSLNSKYDQSGNSYPWFPVKSSSPFMRSPLGFSGEPLIGSGNVSSFGKKTRKSTKKKNRKVVGFAIKKGRVVQVYKVKSKPGKRYHDNYKLPKSKKIYKTRPIALKVLELKRSRKRRKTTAKGSKRKGSKRRKIIGFAVKNRKIYNVYTGRRYSDGTKVPKGKRVHKTINNAKKYIRKKKSKTTIYVLGRRRPRFRVPRRRKSVDMRKKISVMNKKIKAKGKPCHTYFTSGLCGNHSKRCKWENGKCKGKFGNAFGNVINPSAKENYRLLQYATNSATPSVNNLQTLSGTAAYDYPLRSGVSNHRFYKQRNNLSGYGF